MRFDTKIAIAVREDLAAWQQLNVTAFLASGIAGTFGETMGKPYEDGSGHRYLELFRQPVLVYEGGLDALSAARERAVSRGLPAAIYTEEMFGTGHDEANRAVVQGSRPARCAWPAWPCTARGTPWTRSARGCRCTAEHLPRIHGQPVRHYSDKNLAN